LRKSLPSETRISPSCAPDPEPVKELGLMYAAELVCPARGSPEGKPGKRLSSPLYPRSIEERELIKSSVLERRSKTEEEEEEEEGGAG
jgi:hypothetical protein